LAVLVLLVMAGCPSNQAPNPPGVPAGPGAGRIGQPVRFAATATDPDGQMIALRFDWEDGDTSEFSQLVASGDTVAAEHVWSVPGTYRVSAQAKDEKGLQSLWSNWRSIVVADTVNLPPAAPNPPAGPDSANVGDTCDFATFGTDPNGDRIAFQFEWGDGDTSHWGALVGGGTQVTISHAYQSADSFRVRARARDEFGLVSGWSLDHVIVVFDSGR